MVYLFLHIGYRIDSSFKFLMSTTVKDYLGSPNHLKETEAVGENSHRHEENMLTLHRKVTNHTI